MPPLVDGKRALILLAGRSAFFCVLIPCAELPALTNRGREGTRPPRVDCLLYDLRTTIQIEANARGGGERGGAHVMGMGRSCGARVVRWPINKALMTIANPQFKETQSRPLSRRSTHGGNEPKPPNHAASIGTTHRISQRDTARTF